MSQPQLKTVVVTVDYDGAKTFALRLAEACDLHLNAGLKLRSTIVLPQATGVILVFQPD